MDPGPEPVPFLGDHAEGVAISCWVVPGASRTEFSGQHGSDLKVRVAAPPEGGRANTELLARLASTFGTKTELLSGTTARRKVVLLLGADMESVRSTVISGGLGQK